MIGQQRGKDLDANNEVINKVQTSQDSFIKDRIQFKLPNSHLEEWKSSPEGENEPNQSGKSEASFCDMLTNKP